MLATWITRQVVFGGLVDGLTYGLLAMGVVLIFRSTRVINFAVGNMGLPATSLFALLVLNYAFPFWLALAVALAVGTLYGTLIELAVIRRLFESPRVIVLIATVGVAQLSQALMLALPDIDTGGGARFPVAFGSTIDDFVGLRIRGPQLVVVVVVPLVAVALVWSLARTTFGKAVLASADNPDLARLSGVNPKLVSTAVWTIAGFLSSLTMILIAGMAGSPAGLLSLGPATMARALAAAVIAGMYSFPLALAAGVVLGIVQSLVRFNFFDQPGLIDFLLFLAVLVAVYFQSRASDDEIIAFTPKVKPVPPALADRWWVRHLSTLTFGAGLAVAAALPLVIDVPSRHFLYATVVGFAVCGLSVTVITGWAGQLSLSQMTFAGLGALFAATLVRGVQLDVGYGSFRILDVAWGGLPFLAGVVLAPLFTAAIAVLIGLGALRVRGLMLAVSTFAFALAAEQYLYRRPFFTGGATGGVPFPRGTVFGIELSTQRRYYWFCLIGLVIAVAFVAHLRRSGVGRSIIAARDNAASASAYTIEPARTKLLAFALAGGLAGFGGALLGGAFRSVRTSEPLFLVGDSLQLVAMVVIGGIGSVAGPVLGAVWVKGLPAFWPDNDLIPLFTSSIGLLILLLYFPGGFAQVGYSVRDALFAWVLGREERGGVAPTAPAARPVHVRHDDIVERTVPPVALAAHDVTVRFGGNVAVADVTVTVARDEIVGLIGNNGAGKSTFMNAVGGYVPSTGSVELLGHAIDGLSPARRAARGLGRTFQAATLFPELTLRETVMVALEARGHTPFLATALHLPATGRLEQRRRSEADEIIDFLGLGLYADAYVSDLSTGTRRIVEVAGLLALGAKVLCLDEPTAGLAQRETEAFGPLLRSVRAELGASMLVIEHDMPLIMSVSDRVYCLEAGEVIAEGTPDAVRNDPAVIASYLGTDRRAIERSDAAS